MMHSLKALFAVFLLLVLVGCQKDEELALNSQYFIGDWQVIHEHWGLGYFEIDSLFSTDTFFIEFKVDGTCLKKHPSNETSLDWFYRDNPKQLLLTEVGQAWAIEFLYDIVEMDQNFQLWEYGTDIGYYYNLHRHMVQRQ